MVQNLKDARILIVDDQEPNTRLLERILKHDGYTNLKVTTDSRQVLPLFVSFEPDLILLDLQMPHLDGFAVMAQIMPRVRGSYLPILVLTADITPDSKEKALKEGARDFLTKPFDDTEVLLRIKNLLETRFLHRSLQNQNEVLEEKVQERTKELEQAQLEILYRLARAAEYRDDDTGQHTQRVAEVCALLARGLDLPAGQVELIRRAAPLHDVGKIGIPDSILLKPGKLTQDEFNEMKTHTMLGSQILAGSSFGLLQLAEEIALTHHEKWNGSGYPTGLSGEAIPLVGRIVAVADVLDALTHERPYKRAWPLSEALAEIEKQSGAHFDPAVVEVLLKSQQQPAVAELAVAS